MKYLRQLLFFVLISFLTTSCVQVVFEKPMPQKAKTLKKIPESIQGTYSFVMMGGQAKITIGENFVKGEDGMAYLSDSLILKKVDEKYIFNKKITKQNPAIEGKWMTYIVTEAGCGFLRATAISISDETKKDAFEKAYSPRIVGDAQEGYYILNSDDSEFWKIVDNPDATLHLILDKEE